MGASMGCEACGVCGGLEKDNLNQNHEPDLNFRHKKALVRDVNTYQKARKTSKKKAEKDEIRSHDSGIFDPYGTFHEYQFEDKASRFSHESVDPRLQGTQETFSLGGGTTGSVYGSFNMFNRPSNFGFDYNYTQFQQGFGIDRVSLNPDRVARQTSAVVNELPRRGSIVGYNVTTIRQSSTDYPTVSKTSLSQSSPRYSQRSAAPESVAAADKEPYVEEMQKKNTVGVQRMSSSVTRTSAPQVSGRLSAINLHSSPQIGMQMGNSIVMQPPAHGAGSPSVASLNPQPSGRLSLGGGVNSRGVSGAQKPISQMLSRGSTMRPAQASYVGRPPPSTSQVPQTLEQEHQNSMSKPSLKSTSSTESFGLGLHLPGGPLGGSFFEISDPSPIANRGQMSQFMDFDVDDQSDSERK